jgi:hypothetical protein
MFDQMAGSASPPEVIGRFNELFERRYPSTTRESAALVDRICSSSRAENRAAAAQLVAIGEFVRLPAVPLLGHLSVGR